MSNTECYSFEWMAIPYRTEWIRSKRTWTDSNEAADEAAKWLCVNFLNDHHIAVRLCHVTRVEQ